MSIKDRSVSNIFKMKEKIQRFLSIKGRFNRTEYLVAQLVCVALSVLYCVAVYLPFALRSNPNEPSIRDFIITMILLIPYLIFIIYFLLFNECKRLRDLLDYDINPLSFYLYLKFIPVAGWLFAISIYLLPSNGLKNSKITEKLNGIFK